MSFKVQRLFSGLFLLGAPLCCPALQAPVFAQSPNSLAPITVVINGAPVVSDPAPTLIKGVVYVPIRGVLENLGAKVSFNATENRIEITQNGKLTTLRPGVPGAITDAQAVDLTPPLVLNGRAFVPLRDLAELFGYTVNWIPKTRVVEIVDDAPLPQNHRAALDAAGSYGVTIDFHLFAPDQIEPLFDAAQKAGAGLVKTKFDWGTLEKTRGGAFDWALYDRVVGEARKRRIALVGVFADTAPWASNFTGPDENTARRSPPNDKDLPLWSNYVRRVVGRYRRDVHAWQVWTSPNSTNFLSVPRSYRKLASAASAAAKLADKTAIVHLAEPGGADLQTFYDWRDNGLITKSDGIAVFPAASWQQGTLAAPEEFVRPFGELERLNPTVDGKTRDLWLGGIAFPVAAPVEAEKEKQGEAETRFLAAFTPAQQADFLVKAFALARSEGAGKQFWGVFRDAPNQNAVRGITLSPGLIDGQGNARPALGAFQTFAQTVAEKPFASAISFDSKVVALLFDDKREGVVVAWSPSGEGTLALTSTGTNSNAPGVTWIDMRPDGEILSSTGQSQGGAAGLLKLGRSPIFLTGISLQTLQNATPAPKTLLFTDGDALKEASEVSATLDESTPESGLNWRKFAAFPAEARRYVKVEDRAFLTTQPQTNPFDLKTMKPFIHFDVDDAFAFNAPGQNFELEIEVKRPPADTSSIITSVSGFRVEYDGTTGDRSSQFFVVEPGEGWTTLKIPLDKAQFANANGYDLLIDAAGSKKPLTFGKITLRKVTE